jgi:hypothetical protein
MKNEDNATPHHNTTTTHYVTPAMLNARRASPYDSENGCTAEPSEDTLKKARINGNDKPNSGMPSLPLEKLVAPSAEDEFIASRESEVEDCMYVPLDVKLMDLSPSRKAYSDDMPQGDLYATLAKGEEPKELGNAHYGASPRVAENVAAAGEEKLYGIIKWKRDDKNAKGKKLRSKDSIRQLEN